MSWRWNAYREYLRRTETPIIAGPFRGELGFEILYWLPWLMQQLGDLPLYVLTRGGMAGLYPKVSGAVDIYSLRTPQQVRIESLRQYQEHGELKQRHWTPFERALIHDAADALKLSRYRVIHPGWMYQHIGAYWEGFLPMMRLSSRTRYSKLDPLPLPETVCLPPQFAAVKFYFRPTFPPNPATVEFAKQTIAKLATKAPVILLNSGIHADEHFDINVIGDNIKTLAEVVPGITPENNLAIMQGVLARAGLFVGTYGGVAQLALRCGVAGVSYFTEWTGTALQHRELSENLSLQMGIPFVVLRMTEAALVRSIIPEVVFAGSSAARHPAAPYAPRDAAPAA